MTLRVMIVDDEPLAIQRLRQCLGGMPGVELVGEAADGDAAVRRIRELRPDLVLLDIQMPGQNGISVARGLAADADAPEVVFVTAFTEFAHLAFDLEAADYLLKPVRPDRIAEAIRRARRRLELRERGGEGPAGVPSTPAVEDQAYQAEFWIKHRDGFVRVDVAQIQRIEAARDYALLHTATRTHILRATMGELEKRLDPAQLRRVHRSAFVRLETVRRVERNGRNLMRLHAEDGAVIDVGASYSKKVAEALHLDRPALA